MKLRLVLNLRVDRDGFDLHIAREPEPEQEEGPPVVDESAGAFLADLPEPPGELTIRGYRPSPPREEHP